MKRVFFLLCVVVGFYACGPNLSPEEEKLASIERELELQPTVERANEYIDALAAAIGAKREDEVYILPLLQKGLAASKDHGLIHRSPGFLLPLLRMTSDNEARLPLLIDLGDIMFSLKKRHASNVVYRQLMFNYPDNELVGKKRILIDSVAMQSANYVQYLFDQIIVNPDEFGINRNAAMQFIDASEAYALVSPGNKDVPEYLYRAAEAARSMRDFAKSMTLYDWILDEYPDHERSPTVLFIKGFMLEQEFRQTEEARAIYEEFLAKYPDDQMANSAKFLLENLGKSDEEILQSLEGRGPESD